MLEGLVKYVIIGHSETRQYLGETDDMVNQKAKAAARHGLKPIIAVRREPGRQRGGQTHGGFVGAARSARPSTASRRSDLPRIVVAYEPIWAIGTGRSASAERQRRSSARIRGTLAELYGATMPTPCVFSTAAA